MYRYSREGGFGCGESNIAFVVVIVSIFLMFLCAFNAYAAGALLLFSLCAISFPPGVAVTQAPTP